QVMAQPATSNLNDIVISTNDEMIPQLVERIQQATTLDNGLREIASAFSALAVCLEQITMIRNGQQFNFPVNENLSGVRRTVEAKTDQVTITVSCITAMTP